ncbi:dipeptidase-1 [Coleophoma cylindrospora]|uniref:Dipeptidase n=1 Tax=Coleophoma cylindrospora TaxID=1849047 RepID=A0A3D8RAK3_9HELO|nr:dipeptidase-1 [Coleophoma cylindrospora]
MAKDATLVDEHHASLETAKRILREIPLIDGHNDWPCNIRGWFTNDVTRPDFDLNEVPIGQTDFMRLRSGMVGGQFWSAYVSCPPAGQESSDEAHLVPLRKTLQQIDLIHLIIELHPKNLCLARNVQEVWEIFRSGRTACFIGIEGLHQIGNSFSALRIYRSLGVRYATLTHNRSNIYADSVTGSKIHGGLSENGRKAVREMNRIGMIVDLSHTSEDVQEQVLSISRAPVVFSHSSCYSLCPHPRNVSDRILDSLQKNRGIIMICFLQELVRRAEGVAPNLVDVVDHIIYAGEKIGYNHVGIGSDFDGMLRGPEGLDEVSDYPELVATMLQKGISEDQVRKVVGLNILRVIQEVDDAAITVKLDKNFTPACDTFASPWTAEERRMISDEGENRRTRNEPAQN